MTIGHFGILLGAFVKYTRFAVEDHTALKGVGSVFEIRSHLLSRLSLDNTQIL
jgi:hypothetical protein